jgi:hypothetical protein
MEKVDAKNELIMVKIGTYSIYWLFIRILQFN